MKTVFFILACCHDKCTITSLCWNFKNFQRLNPKFNQFTFLPSCDFVSFDNESYINTQTFCISQQTNNISQVTTGVSWPCSVER